jgi:hypothetical protein
MSRAMKAPAAALGAAAVVGMVALSTAMSGGAHGATAAPGGAGITGIESTAPLTLATSIAIPTVTATPYGGEGP